MDKENVPARWTMWRHTNGIVYRVINLANTEAVNDKYPPTVIYENNDTGTLWARPLEGWHKSFTEIVE